MAASALALAEPRPRTSVPARLLARLAAALRWTAWGLSGGAALLMTAQPVSPAAQLSLSLVAVALMAAVWTLLPRTRLSRMGFLAIGSLVVFRYVYWRMTSTLPPLTDPIGFGLGALLLAAELYCVVILAISLVINADPLERAPPAWPDEADLPTVDVFIPTYNEDDYILATTVAAARAIDYPADKLTVWLLDDGGTDQKCRDRDPAKAAAAQARRASLERLCDALGARYLTRARNEHAKAGNLNNGLTASSGEVVVVFDADHAPFRSFLRETIGHFRQDPKLFLVQTPHVFLNPDPIEKNLRTFDRMPSENEMFYSVTQRGLDKWNGSFFCGSAALLRRSALATTGGFSGITITEDCETAFELHARGWTSVYVDKPLIAGLQPETFESFIGQRSRWCQGMFQIMLLKNPALKPGLQPIQRLAYLSSMTFWFFPLPRLAFMLAPLLHIFLDVKIFVSSIDEAVAYTLSYMVVNMMLQNYLYGRVRWPWVSELYEYVQGVYLAKAIASVIWSPRKPTFNVTAKGVSLDDEHLSAMAGPYIAIFGLLFAGVLTAAYRYAFEAGVTNLMLVVGLWCLFNLVIAGVALGAVAERPPAERIPGLPADRSGSLIVGGEALPCRILRASPAGCTVRLDDPGRAPADGPVVATLDVVASGTATGLTPLSVVVGQAADGMPGTLSLAFTDLSDRDYVTVADVMYGDVGPMAAFLAGRRRHKSVPAGTLQMVRWALGEPVRAARYGIAGLRRRHAAPLALAAQAPIAIPDRLVSASVAAMASEAVATSVSEAPVQAPAPMEATAPVQSTVVDVAVELDAVTRTGPLAARPVAVAPGDAPMPLRADIWRGAILRAARTEQVDIRVEAARHGRERTPLTGSAWQAVLLDLATIEAGDAAAPLPASPSNRQAA